MNTFKKIGLVCAMLAFGGLNVVVAVDDVEKEYEQALSDIKGIVEQRNKLRDELAELKIRYGMKEDECSAVAATLQKMFPGETASVQELAERLAATQASLQDALTISQGLDAAPDGNNPDSIVGNVQDVIDKLQERNDLIAEVNQLMYGTTPKEDKEQPLGQLLQDGIVSLIQKQNDTLANLDKAKQDIELANKQAEEQAKEHEEELEQANQEAEALKKDLNKLNRMKDQLNLQLQDLSSDKTGLSDRIEALLQELEDAKKRLGVVRGYFIDLVNYAEQNRD